MEAGGPQTSVTKLATNEGVWYSLNIEGQKKPAPRYEQGAVIAGTSLFILGGNHGGRYLSDLWAFDLAKLQWSAISTKPAQEEAEGVPATPSPCAGHSITVWKNKLLVVGGHYKAKDAVHKNMTVWTLDLADFSWTLQSPAGTPPSARGGHTSVLVGSKLFIFGGEDASRRVVADVAVLDLATLTWSETKIEGKAPTARSCHAAAAYKDRYLLVFGGGSVATCFADLHVLDTATLTWSQPTISGLAPTARAGHAGAVVGDAWYLLGGGNNRSGCTEMLALDLSQLASGTATWSVLCTIPVKSSLSSEGISLLALPNEKALVAFGGYNGKYHNTISIYRVPPPQFPTPAPAQPAAAPPRNQAGAGPAKTTSGPTPPETGSQSGLRSAKEFFTTSPSTADGSGVAPSKPSPTPKAPEPPVEESRTPSAVDNAAHELSLLRHQLTATQSQLTETKQALDQAQTLLAKEHANGLKLEAKVAELQKQLQYVPSLEAELEQLKAQLQEAQKKKPGGGLWGYIAGTPAASS